MRRPRTREERRRSAAGRRDALLMLLAAGLGLLLCWLTGPMGVV